MMDQQGQGQYPIDNNTYNLMQALVSKCESIDAYRKYMNDGDNGSRQLFQQLIDEDFKDAQRILEMLKGVLR
jgi:hypothetical protein